MIPEKPEHKSPKQIELHLNRKRPEYDDSKEEIIAVKGEEEVGSETEYICERREMDIVPHEVWQHKIAKGHYQKI